MNTQYSDNLIEKLDELQKALDAGDYNKLIQGPAIQVTDLSEQAKEFMTAETEAIMNNKLKTLSTDDSVCIYLGVQVRNDDIRTGVQAIVTDLNLLVAEGLVTGALAHVSSVPLARVAKQVESSVVIAYVHVKKDYVDRANSLVQYSISSDADADTTKKLGDLNVKLDDGEFLVIQRYSHQLSMFQGSPNIEQRLHNDVTRMLAILPEGTQYLGMTRLAIIGLSVGYELKFSNPLLARVKEVKLLHTRIAEPYKDTLAQGSVLSGVLYLDKDGQELYK